jgi:predicted phage baseplate assembly protein
MTNNRPGLGAISYRIGTFGTLFGALRARLSSADYPALAELRTRDSSDWSIALLDAWAAVGDVLTFYQERIANEGFVRTASERLSMLEMGRTVGYALRPGVAATAYLAYTMDATADSTIPAGTRTQSTPAQGQLPQSFETAEPLHATGDWNTLGVRAATPQIISLAPAEDGTPALPEQLVFAGANLNLHPDDVLLVVDPNHTDPATNQPLTQALSIVSVTPQPAPGKTTNTQTLVAVKPKTSATGTPQVAHRFADQLAAGANTGLEADKASLQTSLLTRYQHLEADLLKRPAAHPANALQLKQTIATSFDASDQRLSDSITKAIAVVHPALESTLLPALSSAVKTALPVEVHVFRVNAAPFGANAPQQLLGFTEQRSSPNPNEEGTASNEGGNALKLIPDYQEWALAPDELKTALFLDRFYPGVVSNGYVAIVTPGQAAPTIRTIESAQKSGRVAYGISGTTSVLTFAAPWAVDPPSHRTLSYLRPIQVYAQSEPLTLVALPLASAVGGTTIELDTIYDGLNAGRWLVVAGKRTDVEGVPAAELVMLAGTDHTVDPNVPGDKLHTVLTLSDSLAYTYDRQSVVVFGNVVRATHGETRVEVIGSGDGGTPLQQFPLKASPLTYVPVPTRSGAQSTLQITVNGLPWTESPSLDSLGPQDRGFITQTDNAGKTTVIFGDGIHGARLPTGVENVKATYRVGIGQPGNVDAGQLTLLASKPLGVRLVTNPLPATGGADAETVNQGRANIPLATASLDRIVSVADYAAVARTFAGVAKAAAKRFPGAPATVHVTIVADGDATIDPKSSALVKNLTSTLAGLGDPQIRLDVQPRSLVVLVLAAHVGLQSGFAWEVVAPAIRAQLLATFGFAARALEQAVYQTEVIAAIAGVAGVASVGIDIFDSFSDESEADLVTQLQALSAGSGQRQTAIVANAPQLNGDGTIAPAQLAIFKPEIPAAIVLTQIGG